jgi:hypothetical protein
MESTLALVLAAAPVALFTWIAWSKAYRLWTDTDAPPRASGSLMTPAHEALAERIGMRLRARRLMWGEWPTAAAPWTREENARHE